MTFSRRHILGMAGCGLASPFLSGCLEISSPGATVAGSPVTSPENRPDASGESIATYTRKNAAFGLELFSGMIESEPYENVAISPISIAGAVGMVWAGAEGQTAEEIRDTLRFPFDQERFHQTVGALQYDLNERVTEDVDGTLDLAIANALWGQREYPFDEDFLNLLDNQYGATIEEVDFASDSAGAREAINEWAAEATNELIEELFPQGSIDTMTRLVVTNAVSMTADWAAQFEKDHTTDESFTNSDGTTAPVAMMKQTGEFRYRSINEDNVKVIELPYVGESLSMVILLPELGTWEGFSSSLSATWLVEQFDTLDASEPVEVEIGLPRFSFETKISLGAMLESLGMVTPFDATAADFSGIVSSDADIDRLFIDDIYHDTVISVDEEGTEAAAATGVDVGVVSAPPSMIVNRPFMFVIRERDANAVLFLGSVVDATDIE